MGRKKKLKIIEKSEEELKENIKEKISSYGWLEKTRRSWHLWLGNPFYISREIIPLKKATKEKLIKFALKVNKKEKKRFTEKFPDVKWED